MSASIFCTGFNRIDADADTGNGCNTHLLMLTLMLGVTVNRPLDQCGKATKSLGQFGETNHHLQVNSTKQNLCIHTKR